MFFKHHEHVFNLDLQHMEVLCLRSAVKIPEDATSPFHGDFFAEIDEPGWFDPSKEFKSPILYIHFQNAILQVVLPRASANIDEKSRIGSTSKEPVFTRFAIQRKNHFTTYS